MENAGTTGVIPNASNTKKPDKVSGFFISFITDHLQKEI